MIIVTYISRIDTCFFKFFSSFLKVHIFGSIFSLNLSLKTMLNSIKTLIRFCKATLNEIILEKKLFWWKFYLHDKLFVSNQSFTAKDIKIIKNSRFFKVFLRFLFKTPDFFQNFSNSSFFLPKLSSSRFF